MWHTNILTGILVPGMHLSQQPRPQDPLSAIIGPVRLERHSLISFHEPVPEFYKTLVVSVCLSAKLEARTKPSVYLCFQDLEFFICDCFKQKNVPAADIQAKHYSTRIKIILATVSRTEYA